MSPHSATSLAKPNICRNPETFRTLAFDQLQTTQLQSSGYASLNLTIRHCKIKKSVQKTRKFPLPAPSIMICSLQEQNRALFDVICNHVGMEYQDF